MGLPSETAADGMLETSLLFLSFATGILDAAFFPRYDVFVANQTGNTVLLAVGALQPRGYSVNLQRVGISLACFVSGAFLFGRMGSKYGPRRRVWLAISTASQMLMDTAAAAMIWTVSMPRGSKLPLAVTALLSLSSGAQVALARTVKIPEITTAVLTSAYTDVLVDPDLLRRNNRGRNRRIGFILVFLGGAFIGAAASKYCTAALPVSLTAACKLATALIFLFAP